MNGLSTNARIHHNQKGKRRFEEPQVYQLSHLELNYPSVDSFTQYCRASLFCLLKYSNYRSVDRMILLLLADFNATQPVTPDTL